MFVLAIQHVGWLLRFRGLVAVRGYQSMSHIRPVSQDKPPLEDYHLTGGSQK